MFCELGRENGHMPLTLQKIKPISKKDRIVASLREAMISGAIRSGEQIVEGKIAQQLGVGQGVIREALIELEHQGFVQRIPFAGTQVTELTLQDAQQIYDVRIELEPLAFFQAGQSAQAQHISELREMAEKAKGLLSEGLLLVGHASNAASDCARIRDGVKMRLALRRCHSYPCLNGTN